METSGLDLCTYSRSEILARDVLPECPLGLTKAELERCPCKRRVLAELPSGKDLRVIECCFPFKWNGQRIINPTAYAAALRKRRADQQG